MIPPEWRNGIGNANVADSGGLVATHNAKLAVWSVVWRA